MNYIKIMETGKYIPSQKISSKEIEKRLRLEESYITKRTGINNRYYIKDESIVDIAIKAVSDLFTKDKEKIEDIGLIIVATTSSKHLMPGISNQVQKYFNLKPCICLDILAGCSGYINAFDIAKMYIETGKVEKAIVIGVDTLSKFTNKEDVGTVILLSDGAGATMLEKSDRPKKYYSNIQAQGNNNEILTCKADEKIQMKGIEIYKYAITETVNNIEELLRKTNEKLENIKYIIPHQSNIKIMRKIAEKLNISMDKIYTNIEEVGNTFCASIPIALDEMNGKCLLKPSDKVILIGYGGGLNTGSILIEI